MKNILITLMTICFLFPLSNVSAATMEETRAFLKHMKPACGGENECYYRMRRGFLRDSELGGLLYFACKDQYADEGARTLGFEKFGKCLAWGSEGLVAHFREIGDNDSADYVQGFIDDCETWGGYDSQFKCYKNYYLHGKGKNVHLLQRPSNLYCKIER